MKLVECGGKNPKREADWAPPPAIVAPTVTKSNTVGAGAANHVRTFIARFQAKNPLPVDLEFQRRVVGGAEKIAGQGGIATEAPSRRRSRWRRHTGIDPKTVADVRDRNARPGNQIHRPGQPIEPGHRLI